MYLECGINCRINIYYMTFVLILFSLNRIVILGIYFEMYATVWQSFDWYQTGYRNVFSLNELNNIIAKCVRYVNNSEPSVI